MATFNATINILIEDVDTPEAAAQEAWNDVADMVENDADMIIEITESTGNMNKVSLWSVSADGVDLMLPDSVS